jgi:hypothetical protein
VLRLFPATAGNDETEAADYVVDADDDRITETPVLV